MYDDYIEIGSVPNAEPCAQVGKPNYDKWSKLECHVYIAQLRRQFGPEPDGARLCLHANPHDFGIYYQVQCKYNSSKPDAVNYAFMCEAESPENWDQQALCDLGPEYKAAVQVHDRVPSRF